MSDRWRPSSPVAEAPGQWGSAWTYAYPAQERVEALRRLLGGGAAPRTPVTTSPASGQPRPSTSALLGRGWLAAWGGRR